MIEIARCQASLCGVTLLPDASAPLITQMLYGEFCQIIEKEGYYTKVKTASDDITGWVFSQNIKIVEEIPEQTIITQPFKTININGEERLLSIGAEIISKENNEKELINLGEIALQFLHTPYLSGGRSIFGTDASGFAQLVYKCAGIHLPRTAQLQAEHGTALHFIEESKAGDLAFFENENQEISHIGIMLENLKIIHAFGSVRIDYLDSVGIYNSDLKKHTHFLRFIKRITI